MAGLAIAHVPVKDGQAITRIGRVPGRTVSGTVPDGPAALPRPPRPPPQGSRCGFPSRARAIPDPDSPYHLRGLQTRSHHAVPLDHRPKLSVTSCVKAAEVQRGRGVSPRSPSPTGAAARLRVGEGTRCVVPPPPGPDHGPDRWPCLGQVRACVATVWDTRAGPRPPASLTQTPGIPRTAEAARIQTR